MNSKSLGRIVRVVAVATLAISVGFIAHAQSQTSQHPATVVSIPHHLGGAINDYTPLNDSATPTGPYEMRGHWSLDLKDGFSKADFSLFMNMELSDYWLIHSNTDPVKPDTRNPHTHHIILNDATVTFSPTTCPADSPATTARFAIKGTAKFITGNGSPGPFEKNGPSTLTVCVTGGTDVTYSNITMTITGPATSHFGTQAIHGVVRFTHKNDNDRDYDHHER